MLTVMYIGMKIIVYRKDCNETLWKQRKILWPRVLITKKLHKMVEIIGIVKFEWIKWNIIMINIKLY